MNVQNRAAGENPPVHLYSHPDNNAIVIKNAPQPQQLRKGGGFPLPYWVSVERKEALNSLRLFGALLLAGLAYFSCERQTPKEAAFVEMPGFFSAGCCLLLPKKKPT